MLLNTVLSAPNAELEVDFVILLDLEPLRVSAGDAKKAGSVCPQDIPSLPHILFRILILECASPGEMLKQNRSSGRHNPVYKGRGVSTTSAQSTTMKQR